MNRGQSMGFRGGQMPSGLLGNSPQNYQSNISGGMQNMNMSTMQGNLSNSLQQRNLPAGLMGNNMGNLQNEMNVRNLMEMNQRNQMGLLGHMPQNRQQSSGNGMMGTESSGMINNSMMNNMMNLSSHGQQQISQQQGMNLGMTSSKNMMSDILGNQQFINSQMSNLGSGMQDLSSEMQRKQSAAMMGASDDIQLNMQNTLMGNVRDGAIGMHGQDINRSTSSRSLLPTPGNVQSQQQQSSINSSSYNSQRSLGRNDGDSFHDRFDERRQGGNYGFERQSSADQMYEEGIRGDDSRRVVAHWEANDDRRSSHGLDYGRMNNLHERKTVSPDKEQYDPEDPTDDDVIGSFMNKVPDRIRQPSQSPVDSAGLSCGSSITSSTCIGHEQSDNASVTDEEGTHSADTYLPSSLTVSPLCSVPSMPGSSDATASVLPFCSIPVMSGYSASPVTVSTFCSVPTISDYSTSPMGALTLCSFPTLTSYSTSMAVPLSASSVSSSVQNQDNHPYVAGISTKPTISADNNAMPFMYSTNPMQGCGNKTEYKVSMEPREYKVKQHETNQTIAEYPTYLPSQSITRVVPDFINVMNVDTSKPPPPFKVRNSKTRIEPLYVEESVKKGQTTTDFQDDNNRFPVTTQGDAEDNYVSHCNDTMELCHLSSENSQKISDDGKSLSSQAKNKLHDNKTDTVKGNNTVDFAADKIINTQWLSLFFRAVGRQGLSNVEMAELQDKVLNDMNRVELLDLIQYGLSKVDPAYFRNIINGENKQDIDVMKDEESALDEYSSQKDKIIDSIHNNKIQYDDKRYLSYNNKNVRCDDDHKNYSINLKNKTNEKMEVDSPADTLHGNSATAMIHQEQEQNEYKVTNISSTPSSQSVNTNKDHNLSSQWISNPSGNQNYKLGQEFDLFQSKDIPEHVKQDLTACKTVSNEHNRIHYDKDTLEALIRQYNLSLLSGKYATGNIEMIANPSLGTVSENYEVTSNTAPTTVEYNKDNTVLTDNNCSLMSEVENASQMVEYDHGLQEKLPFSEKVTFAVAKSNTQASVERYVDNMTETVHNSHKPFLFSNTKINSSLHKHTSNISASEDTNDSRITETASKSHKPFPFCDNIFTSVVEKPNINTAASEDTCEKRITQAAGNHHIQMSCHNPAITSALVKPNINKAVSQDTYDTKMTTNKNHNSVSTTGYNPCTKCTEDENFIEDDLKDSDENNTHKTLREDKVINVTGNESSVESTVDNDSAESDKLVKFIKAMQKMGPEKWQQLADGSLFQGSHIDQELLQNLPTNPEEQVAFLVRLSQIVQQFPSGSLEDFNNVRNASPVNPQKRSLPLLFDDHQQIKQRRELSGVEHDILQNGGSEKFHCQLCNVGCLTVQNFDQHMHSDVHMQRMASITSLYQARTEQQIQRMRAEEVLRRVEQAGKDDECNICQKKVHESIQEHTQGQEHVRKERLTKRGCILCKTGSFDNYPKYVAHIDSDAHKEAKKVLNKELSGKKKQTAEIDGHSDKSDRQSHRHRASSETESSKHKETSHYNDKHQTVEKKEVKQEPQEVDVELLQGDLIFDPDMPVGQSFVIPVKGFFCKLCHKFYNNEDMAKNAHCKSEKHFEKYQEYVVSQRQDNDTPVSQTSKKSAQNNGSAKSLATSVKSNIMQNSTGGDSKAQRKHPSDGSGDAQVKNKNGSGSSHSSRRGGRPYKQHTK